MADHVVSQPEIELLRRLTAGRFVIDRELGRGGMGIVVLARDVALDRPVAIKLLPLISARNPALRARFLREARLAAGLAHPHIVPIHAVEEHDDAVFFVMGYIRGETLTTRVRTRGPLPADDAARILREVAWALAYAHSHGIVHRDVKPDNILIEAESGRTLVADFGIAHQVEPSASATSPGEVIGTTAYMSPEQAAGEPVDARSDLYSLGMSAFFMLTARLPFEGAAAQTPIARQLFTDAPGVAEFRPSLPGLLAAAVDRCLARDPRARFGSAEAFADALAPLQQAGIPGVLRTVHEEAHQLVSDAGGAGSIILMILAQWAAIAMDVPGLDDNAGFFNLLIPAGLTVLLGARGSALMLRVRRALREGATTESIAAASQRLADDERVATGPTDGRRLAIGLVAGWVILAWAWTNDFQGLLQGGEAYLQMFVGTATLVLGLFLGRVASEHFVQSRTGFWSRFWHGPIGRLIVAKAGVGLKARPVAEAAGPTEVILAGEAGRLLDALPPHEREPLNPLRAVISALEADAARLRVGLMRENDRHTRDAIQARLGTTVAALDGIRVELIRLNAGLEPTEGVTERIAAAIRLGDHVDRRLAALEELRRLLERHPSTESH